MHLVSQCISHIVAALVKRARWDTRVLGLLVGTINWAGHVLSGHDLEGLHVSQVGE